MQQPTEEKTYWTPMSVWLALTVLLVVLSFQPVETPRIRLLELYGFGLWWGVTLWPLWRRRLLRYAWLVVTIIALVWLSLPGWEPNAGRLRPLYVGALRSYTGTQYREGGENAQGMDCCGLVRRGMIDACMQLAVLTGNPQALRIATAVWWHDTEARQLEQQYNRAMIAVATGASINSSSGVALLPGDVAVTQGSGHALAYLGNSLWVQASPRQGRVIEVTVPAPDNPWLEQPVQYLRWKWLQDK